MDLVRITRKLARKVDDLRFSEPVTHVYNPLDYARRAHETFLKRYGEGTKELLLVGMNPGPFGMAQTGVPFGAVPIVREWLDIEEKVDRPDKEHPKRPIQGFDCHRNEVSGQRLWGWARDRFGAPETFFRRFFVWNYCPLVFMEESGRNRTPDKLPVAERDALFETCDCALRQVVETLEPRMVIGIGAFAEQRAKSALEDLDVPIGRILHPSPASPKANNGWVEAMEADLKKLGVRI